MTAPLDPLTLGLLRCWADAQPDDAKVGISTLRAVLDTAVTMRRELRDAKAESDAAWAIVAADLTPDPNPMPGDFGTDPTTDWPTDFPKDA